jgi:type II secretory pathway component HofQ
MSGCRPAGRFVFLATAFAALAAVPPAAQQPADLPVVRLESVYGAQSTGTPGFPVTRLEDGPAAGDLDRISAGSLTLSQPMPIRDVLFLLFRGTPFSIVLDADVSGTFAGELADLSLREALDAVLAPAGLEYQRRGRVVRVLPRRPETRLFEVSHVDVARAWRRRVGDGDAASAMQGAELTSRSESDFFGELSAGVAALLSPAGRVHVDRKAGVVQVTDFAERLRQIGIYIETVTLRASRQVRLAARVLDVTLGDYPAIDWAVVGRNAGIAPGTGAGIHVEDFDALLRAVGAFGSVRTVAAPHVLAMNNEAAVMTIGAAGATFLAGENARDTEAVIGAALTLSIVPQISADGIVHMSVSPAYVDERSGSRPHPNVTALDTVMRVRGGDTVVIAGLVRERIDATASGGLPGLFGRKDEKRARRELVVLITPTIVSAGTSPASGVQ